MSDGTIGTIDSKAALRKHVFALRKTAHTEAGDAALRARDRFLEGGWIKRPTVVSGYRPIRTEIDPTPLMDALIAAGHRVCVPVIEEAGKPLLFREWTPGCAMETGAFGAEVPASGDWMEPELLIAPLVAFDAGCWRLGYGGGFYDRTLLQLRAARPTLAIGFAYAVQQVERIPREPTDQPLDAVVTPEGALRREAAD